MKLIALVVALLALASCSSVERHEVDVGGGKMAVYVVARDRDQLGATTTCPDIWQDGKLLTGSGERCAKGPSLLQSLTAGTTAGTTYGAARRVNKFISNETETLVNEQSQHQGQHQNATARSRSNSNSSASASSMPAITIVGTPPTVPMD